MKKAIILPVYLKLKAPEELTSSEGMGLTQRAIRSLHILKDQDFTLILPVCFDLPKMDENLHLELEEIFKEEIGLLRTQRTLLFSSARVERLRLHLAQINFKDYNTLIDLKGFSKIRNTGLLLAQALSIEMVIFMDNDEVIENPEHLDVASEYLDQRFDGKRVGGKGGFYLNPDGSILLPPRKLWWDWLWDKIRWMNQTYLEILKSKERLVPTPMLLGGNLVLHYRLFQSVPFDPLIPRGEDTDYLINAARLGFCILFDPKLQIKHHHPERTETYYEQELKGDIERFLYERQKVKEGMGLSLDPYPGYFLRRRVYPKAILTTFFLALDYFVKGKRNRAKGTLSILREIFKKREGWSYYFKFREAWERMMKRIREEGMEEIVRECWI
jgi:glycosyltransferase involved in cell wall biosynthesis